jgi:hypothetical protein
MMVPYNVTSKPSCKDLFLIVNDARSTPNNNQLARPIPLYCNQRALASAWLHVHKHSSSTFGAPS